MPTLVFLFQFKLYGLWSLPSLIDIAMRNDQLDSNYLHKDNLLRVRFMQKPTTTKITILPHFLTNHKGTVHSKDPSPIYILITIVSMLKEKVKHVFLITLWNCMIKKVQGDLVKFRVVVAK
jgi:hypothetical protein